MKHSRREFINYMKLVAGGSVLAGTLPWITTLRADPLKAASDKVNIGIIGVGGRGRLLLNTLKKIEGANIVAVCDDYEPNYNRALDLTNKKAKGYKDYRKLLDQKDIDAVVIATPLYLHKKMTLDSFAAGKHVFCEKAMAMNVADCMAMVEARKQTGKVFQIGHQRLFDLTYLEAMEQIKANKLGNITQMRGYWHRNNNWRRSVPDPKLERKINWRLYREYSLGLLTELGTHHFQLAHWILDKMPVSVMGSGGLNYWNDGREVYDNINFIFRYDDGTHFIYDSMISNKKYGAEFQVMGNLGTMELETGWRYKEEWPTGVGAIEYAMDLGKYSKNDNVDGVSSASWKMEEDSSSGQTRILEGEDFTDSSQLQLEGFTESVRNNRHEPELEKQGLNASLMAMYANQAMMEQRVVNIPS
jgi:predicted dehydrogenase